MRILIPMEMQSHTFVCLFVCNVYVCVCVFSFLREYKKQFDLTEDVKAVQKAHPEM